MKKLKRNWLLVTVACIGISFIIILIAVYFFNSSIMKSSIAAIYSYNDAKTQAREETYENFYLKGYETGEEQNHVSNTCNISIGDIKEKAALEVLKVSDVVFIDNQEKKETIWFEAEGTGVFTVDLRAGEYIVDNNRKYVLVRVPCPELNPDSIDISNCKKLLFVDNKFNSEIKEGVKLAQKNLSEAKMKVMKDFTSNQEYYNAAKQSAESLIKRIVSM